MNHAPSISPPPHRCAVIYCASKNPTAGFWKCPKIPIKITNVTIYVPGIRRSIIPIKIKKIAPMIIAITEVSPIVPGIVPISMSIELTAFPDFRSASGVAPVTPS